MEEKENKLEKLLKDSDAHMISQPFLTEEGFVNEACMNEFNKAIINMPKTYERLNNDIEWNVKRWTFKDDITGSFAKSAIKLSPYSCPNNLEKVIKYLDACLEKEIDWGEYGLVELSLCDINKLLYDILYEQNISICDEWNEPKKNWRKTEFSCLGEASKEDPDFDYISLDALFHNVCLDIRRERRADDKSDKEFKEEYGKDKE
jgi:hypothetical protein